MRQGQHKNRSRGRGRRQGGGGGSPSNRVYDSNGPDVKVRGTAQTVADKYTQLARDAQAAGDTVMAESYYQFAEHYLRIVFANQAQQQAHQQRREEANAETAQANGAAEANEDVTDEPVAEASKETETVQDQPPAEAMANGSDAGDWNCAPDFLKKPVEKTTVEAKPRRPRARKAPKSDAEINGSEPQPEVEASAPSAENDSTEQPSVTE